jgi:hypothetical protein
MAPRSLALVLLATIGTAAAVAAMPACTSGATPNCSPDATGSDACGLAFEGGEASQEESGGDGGAPESAVGSPMGEAAADTGGGSDTGHAMEAGAGD